MIENGPVEQDINTLVVHARGLMEAIEQVFEANGVSLPARRYIASGGAGDVAFDCEQLTVSIEQVYGGSPGQQGQEPANCNQPSTAVAIVILVRCVPVVNQRGIAPTPAEIEASTISTLQDIWLLKQAGQLFGAEQDFLGSLVDVTIGGPNGGFQPCIMSVAASVV